MKTNKILALSLLGMMVSSQVSASDEIACPAGSNCWKCGDNCTATLTGGQMTISGTGAMYDYPNKTIGNAPWGQDTPWADHRLEIESIVIGDNITRVGNFAFALSYNVTELKLGASLESIGNGAFRATSTDEIRIPASVKTLENYAFSSSYNADNAPTSLVFEEGSQLESIGEGTFQRLKATSVKLPDSLKSIGAYAFGASDLTYVKLPNNSNLVLGDQIFSETNLTDIVLPEDLTSARSFLRNLPGNPTVYCTQAVINSRKCTSSYLGKSPLKVAHYERDGDHFNVYNAQGEIIAQYGSFIDFGTTNYYVPKAPKEAKRIYTVPEAVEALGTKNKNTFSIKYR